MVGSNWERCKEQGHNPVDCLIVRVIGKTQSGGWALVSLPTVSTRQVGGNAGGHIVNGNMEGHLSRDGYISYIKALFRHFEFGVEQYLNSISAYQS